MPSFPVPEVAPLRTRDATALTAALAALKPPFSDELRAELIVLALAHQDAGVKKKATSLAKHVPEFADWKAAKALAGSQPHQIEEKFNPFEHPLNGKIKTVPDEIAGMTSLRDFELQSAPVTKLPAAVAKLPALKKINVRWTRLDEAAVAELKAVPGLEVESG